jgi:hypothetical protein
MKKYTLYIVLGSLLSSTPVYALTPEELATVFFDKLPTEPESALDGLLASNPSIKADDNQVMSLKALLKNYPNIHGIYQFSERICSYAIGEHIKRLTYIAGYEKSPMTFDFIFYNDGDEWQLNSIDADTMDIRALLQISIVRNETTRETISSSLMH